MNKIITDLDERWEQEIPHHPESEKLARKIAELDESFGGGVLDLQFGGDGDNGEHLMYLLDIFFESENV